MMKYTQKNFVNLFKNTVEKKKERKIKRKAITKLLGLHANTIMLTN